MEQRGLFDQGVPVDVQISLNTKTYLYLGGTVTISILVGIMLADLVRRATSK